MRTISSILLTILMGTTAHAEDSKLALPAAPALAVRDQMTVATKTTITLGTGEAARQATRQDGYSVEIEALDGETIARAKLRYDATTITGTWPTTAPRFAETNVSQTHVAARFPFTAVLSGKTFVPGKTVALGGNDLDLLWDGGDGSISAASMTYQKLDAGIATFEITATLSLALPEATQMELTGRLTVDTATGRVVSLSMAGATDSVRVAQLQTFVFHT